MLEKARGFWLSESVHKLAPERTAMQNTVALEQQGGDMLLLYF